jgi:RNA binding exosome subunit
MSLPISFLEIRVFSHATENVEKVLATLRQITADEVLAEEELVHEELEGHHGNPITLIKTRVYKKAQVRKIIQNIVSRLDRTDRESLSSNIEDRIDDDGCLFIRVDKQAAYNGKIKLATADPIHIQIKLSMPRKQRGKIVEVSRSLFSGEMV